MTFPGSCTASGLRHGASAADSSAPTPTARTVSTNATAPAWDTTPDPKVSTRTTGYNPLRLFTWKVLLDPARSDSQQATSFLVRSTFQLINTDRQPTVGGGSGAGAVALLAPRFQPPPVEPCMRFSRTRLTDVVHRRHSVSPARPGRAWVRRRFRAG